MSPMCYNFGITNILVQTIMGYTLLCMPEFTLNKYFEAIAEYKPTVLQLMPSIIHAINADKKITSQQLASVKLIVSGGSALGAASLSTFTQKFPQIKVVAGYAMTETCGPNMSRMIKVRTPESVGVLLGNTQARIVDCQNGTNLGPNQIGELYIRGPQVMNGYYRNNAATKKVLDCEGWLRTGDMAYYDINQEFFVTNRLVDYIKVNGKWVSPIELEDILRGHSCIKDVAVVAVENETNGHIPKAYIVLHTGCDCDLLVFQNFVDDKVESHKKLLGGIAVVDFIPKSLGGKVNKTLLK